MTVWEIFQETSKETRWRAFDYLCDQKLYIDSLNDQASAANDNDAALDFIYDVELQDLLLLWIECHEDDVLTKLSWNSRK